MSRSRSWLCTWNNFPEDWQSVIEHCGAVDYSAQKEKGKDAEKEHIQFAVRFELQKAFASVQELFKGAHIEPAKDWIKAKQYCMKKDTQVEEGIVSKPQLACKDPLEGKVPRPIQQQILDIIKTEPDDRSIYWFYDPDGNIGKTSLAKSICLKDKSVINLAGKSADMRYGVQAMVVKGKPPRAVFMNLARSIEGFVSYQGMEEVKDGFFFSTKYECGMVIYDCPHMIVLANFMPDTGAMSMDRWKIWECQGVDKPAKRVGAGADGAIVAEAPIAVIDDDDDFI